MNEQKCADIKMNRVDIIVKSQARHVFVYDYYEPSKLSFYQISMSPVVKTVTYRIKTLNLKTSAVWLLVLLDKYLGGNL